MYNYMNNYFNSNEEFDGDRSKIITFEKLDELGIINGFTLKPYNFRRNYVTVEEIDINLERLENTFEYTFALRMQPVQTHTNNVAVITADNLNSTFDDTDGLITNLKGILLTSILADCTGFLLYDPVKKVIGSIHSGWKGTLGRICSNAIKLMIDTYSCDVSDIQVYVTPTLLQCCFEVQDDVKDMFVNEFKDIDVNKYIKNGDIVDGNQKYYIDSNGINKEVLINLGIKEDNITMSDMCTKCNNDIMHSHRGDGPQAGRNIAFICLK